MQSNYAESPHNSFNTDDQSNIPNEEGLQELKKETSALKKTTQNIIKPVPKTPMVRLTPAEVGPAVKNWFT